ncbi:hypothetical protein [Fischerella thermalis]|uniref:hypothetical protein n=1 Tax=Fischerella thermalis TaxID=372787 RepID=UPI002155727D|nr:hypothetical protein [Fischerella thermalis]
MIRYGDFPSANIKRVRNGSAIGDKPCPKQPSQEGELLPTLEKIAQQERQKAEQAESRLLQTARNLL